MDPLEGVPHGQTTKKVKIGKIKKIIKGSQNWKKTQKITKLQTPCT
jgi:hypothetical protein